MGLLNENQISHMNLLTLAVFHLLLTAMLRTRFSEECMGFLLPLRVFFRLFLSEELEIYIRKKNLNFVLRIPAVSLFILSAVSSYKHPICGMSFFSFTPSFASTVKYGLDC